MVGCTNSLKKGPTGTSSSTICQVWLNNFIRLFIAAAWINLKPICFHVLDGSGQKMNANGCTQTNMQ